MRLRLAQPEQHGTEPLPGQAVLGIELEQGPQPIFGQLPVLARFRHRGQPGKAPRDGTSRILSASPRPSPASRRRSRN